MSRGRGFPTRYFTPPSEPVKPDRGLCAAKVSDRILLHVLRPRRSVALENPRVRPRRSVARQNPCVRASHLVRRVRRPRRNVARENPRVRPRRSVALQNPMCTGEPSRPAGSASTAERSPRKSTRAATAERGPPSARSHLGTLPDAGDPAFPRSRKRQTLTGAIPGKWGECLRYLGRRADCGACPSAGARSYPCGPHRCPSVSAPQIGVLCHGPGP